MEHLTVMEIIAFLGLSGTMIGGYVKLMTKIRELEIRLTHVEKQDDKILAKLDSIEEKINNVNIQIQNKQDK